MYTFIKNTRLVTFLHSIIPTFLLVILAMPFFSMVGCNNKMDQGLLQGEWQATSLQINDSIWDVELSPIKLILTGEKYYLSWYGSDADLGTWSATDRYLHIKNKNGHHARMQLNYIPSDSLLLKGEMNDQIVTIGLKRYLTHDTIEIQ